MCSLLFAALAATSFVAQQPRPRLLRHDHAAHRGRALRCVAADAPAAAAPEAAPLEDGTWEISEANGLHSMRVAVAGKVMSFETGKMARQAHGSVIVKTADTHVYGACCYEKPDDLSAMDFSPLRVDYFERSSAAGLTKGGYIK
eukprot:242202-Prymnesium_polylepis.1